MNTAGLTVQKSPLIAADAGLAYSPNGTYDNDFLANYAYINMVDELTRVHGIAQSAGVRGRPVCDALLGESGPARQAQITVPQIIAALHAQNTVNPAGQIGGEPVPTGQQFTYTVRAQGRLISPEEFGNIVLRANPTARFSG